MHCVIRKLDVPTKEAWNVSRENKTDFATYKEISAFLENRLQTLMQTRKCSAVDKKSSSSQGKRDSVWAHHSGLLPESHRLKSAFSVKVPISFSDAISSMRLHHRNA